MKFVYLLSAILVLAMAAHAQGPKIGLVNSNQFGADKVGITKLVNAYNALDIEFKAASDEIVQINTKLSNLAKEIQQGQQNPNPTKAIQDQLLQKTDEGQNLQVTLKRKQEDAKIRYERREKEVTGPIIKEISDALQAYAKSHGIDLLLDASKLEPLVYFNPTVDITDAFIKEFNAKASGIPIKQ